MSGRAFLNTRLAGGLFVVTALAMFAATYASKQVVVAVLGVVLLGMGARALTRAGLGSGE